MQGIRNNTPLGGDVSDAAKDMASAILDPGYTHGNFTADASWKTEGCDTVGLCDWANAKDIAFVNDFKKCTGSGDRWCGQADPNFSGIWFQVQNALDVNQNPIPGVYSRATYLFYLGGNMQSPQNYFAILNSSDKGDYCAAGYCYK